MKHQSCVEANNLLRNQNATKLYLVTLSQIFWPTLSYAVKSNERAQRFGLPLLESLYLSLLSICTLAIFKYLLWPFKLH